MGTWPGASSSARWWSRRRGLKIAAQVMSYVGRLELTLLKLSLRAKRGICCCLCLERQTGKQQIPHGLNQQAQKTALVGGPGSAVRDDNSAIAKTGHNLCSTQ